MPSHGGEEEEKPCRACSDFQSWAQKQSVMKPTTKTGVTTTGKSKDCPLDKQDLGRSSWGLLHSVASYFPEKPTEQDQRNMCRFMYLFAQFYPCEPCRIDFVKDVKDHPPKTATRDELAKWVCDRHNTVNRKLNKPLFDCSKVHERWRDGWLDGSCD